MARQNVTRRTSAKFVVLTDSESIASAKRNYLTWIISGTVLFGITAGFLCHKVFLAPIYFNSNNQSMSSDSASSVAVTLKSLSPGSLFPETALRKRLGKNQSDFLCEQYRTELETIPMALRKKLFQEHYTENIYDHINTDLLVHYESIMSNDDLKYLKTIFNKYQQKLSEVRESSEFINFLRILTSNKFKFYSGYLKKQQYQLNLRHFNWFFALTEELNQWYNYLDRLRNFISDYEQQSHRKTFEKITELNFMKFTAETQQKIFRFVYPFGVTEKKLDEVNKIMKEWTKPIRVDYNNCSVTLFNRAVLLSEVIERINALNASCVKNVYIYASGILYLDKHLELPEVNLAIISPEWRFLKKIKINLDGASGEEYVPKTASPGEAGKPGNPGTNGGDFLGVGSFEENFLSISANGGTGGRGQNGAKGRDGLNNTRPSSPFNKPACVMEVKALKNMFPVNIAYYKIYHEAGCGGSGTDGGVGGRGGYGGIIILMNQSYTKVIKGLDGASGPFGKGGSGGAGGRNGCFYEALDENDKFLYPVTTIKCSNESVLPSGTPGKDNHNNRELVFPPAKENLSVHHSVFDYIRLAEEHSLEFNNPQAISFLKKFNFFEEIKLDDLLKDFKLIEKFNKMEFFEFFKDRIFERFSSTKNNTQLIIVNYLKSIILGHMTYLKNNVNYFFVDIKNYFNVLQASIKNTNENNKQLQAVSYFEGKVWIKIDEIKDNLKLLKENLSAGDVVAGNGSKYKEKEKSVLCIMLVAIDIINVLIDRSNELTHLQLNRTLNICSMTAQPTLTNLQWPLFGRKESIFIKSTTERSLLKTLLQILLLERELEKREHLTELRGTLDVLEESNVFSERKTQLFHAMIDEVERFISLYDFLEWKNLADSFLKSLDDLKISEDHDSILNANIERIKGKLLDVMVVVQLKLGEDALRQTVHPLSKANFFQLSTEKELSDVLKQLNLVKDLSDLSPFCKNYMKAVFEKNSTVGAFFSWPNSEIRSKLKILFSGAEIHLKSNLINRHVLDKSFLQFASLKLDFDCLGNKSFCDKFREILMNFKIDITHSGYSFYNWDDKTHVVVSEKVTLSYNFRTQENQEPELYNAFFKKCQDGEIKLSPFTTWSVRLYLMNESASFKMLAPFADVINLNLIGTGTYIL